jgi:hypothetical protein
MEKVEKIQAELKELVSKAIEVLEKNYNTEDVEFESPAAALSLSLELALSEISDLNLEDLK